MDNGPSPDHQCASNEANYSPDNPKTVPAADQLFDPVLNVNREQICESKEEDEEYMYGIKFQQYMGSDWKEGGVVVGLEVLFKSIHVNSAPYHLTPLNATLSVYFHLCVSSPTFSSLFSIYL